MSDARPVRALFSARPFHGHLDPAFLLADAVVAAGGSSVFATAGSVRGLVAARGFPMIDAGIHPSDPGNDNRDYGRRVVGAKARDLLAGLPDIRPDVIVRDPTDIAAVIAGEVAGVPTVTLGFSEFIPAKSWAILSTPDFARVRDDFGLPPDPQWQRMHPGGYIDLVPNWFHEVTVDADPVIPMQPCPMPGYAVPPDWLDATRARPTVGFCLGTIYHQETGLLELLVRTTYELGVNSVILLGPRVTRPAWAKGTPGIWAVPYLPLARLLPRLDVLVTSGGFNTVMAALAHGVPMLGVPGGADQPRNARRAKELGCGLVLARSEVSPTTVAEAVTALLTDGSYRVRATRRQDLMAAIPSPRQVVTKLSERVGEHRRLVH